MASMAGTQPSSPLDTLQLMINDVLVNMGKALRSSQRDSKRAPSSSSTTRAYEANERFNSALDDLEQELIEAKAVLYRDLDRLRASKLQPAMPEPVPAPAPELVAAQQAPPAPMTLDGPPLDLSGPSGQLMADSKPIAPFPNMDLEPSAPVPQMMAETKMEIQSPQPATKVDPTVPRGPVQNEAPNHLSVAKTRSPNLTKASPAAKVESPASVASKTTMQQGPTSVSQDTGLDFGSGGLSLGQLPGSSNPELNFTDMHFSLAPAPADSQNATQQSESVFDLDAFLAGETMPSAPADNSGGGGTAGQAEVAPMDIPMPTVEASKEPAKVDDTNLDDLFDLNGTSMDMGLDGEGVDGTTNFDEMFFEAGDTEMGEFDNAYFGLDG